jgi:hypothetical protein
LGWALAVVLLLAIAQLMRLAIVPCEAHDKAMAESFLALHTT